MKYFCGTKGYGIVLGFYELENVRRKDRYMGLYTVLLVDDEPEIREGIIQKIDWNAYGFEIIGSAENGRDALEIAEQKMPDVVMTDVMMPFMDGLQLGEELMRKMPSTKLILFSGADDFEYVQKALKIKAVEYVLKPIDAGEFSETLKKLKTLLDEEYEEKRNIENLRQHYIDTIPVFREQFLVGLLDGRIDFDQLEKKCGMAQIDLEAWGYTTGLLWIEPNQEEIITDLFKNHDEALIPTTLKQMADSILEPYGNVVSCYYGDMVGLVANLYEKNDIYRFMEGMDQVCKSMEKVYGLTVTGGIGKVCDSPMELRYAKKEAQTALSYRISLGGGQAIYLGDVEPEKSAFLQFQGPDETELIAAIKLGNEEEIHGQIDYIFKRLKDSTLSMEQLKVYVIEVKVSFIKLLQYYDMKPELLFGLEEAFQITEEFITLEDVRSFMLSKSLKMSRLIKESRSSSQSAITTKAKEYVLSNYSDEKLSVDYMSQILHVSPSYFSSLFKKEMGISFITYLTNVRMDKAVELLDTTDDKSYMIAEKVGYAEANYFSYVFKKHFGISPQRYRKRS